MAQDLQETCVPVMQDLDGTLQQKNYSRCLCVHLKSFLVIEGRNLKVYPITSKIKKNIKVTPKELAVHVFNLETFSETL